MNRFKRYFGHGFRNKRECKALPYEITKSGLAYTPADMERMTSQGIPIQSQDLSAQFYDGSPDASFDDITSDRIKSNDINDMWEEHQKFIKFARHAKKNSKKVTSKTKKDDN